jgi:hypothetical protein
MTNKRGGHGEQSRTEESAKLDNTLKVAAPRVYQILKDEYPELTWSPGLKREANDECGVSPDGGIFSYKGTIVAAFEAKHQGPRGNAIERWCKNYLHLKTKSPTMTYVTFATGAGVAEFGPVKKHFNTHFRRIVGEEPTYNVIRPGCTTVYLSEHGFQMDYVEAEVVKCVKASIRSR